MFRRLALLLCLTLPTLAAAQTPAQNPSFNLVNKSTQPIRELFVSPAGRTNFGQNRLTTGPIAVGNKFAVRLLADGNCIFDIRAVFADNSHEDRRSVNTCSADDIILGAAMTKTATTPAAANAKAPDDPSFRLLNRGSQPITELYATPAGQTRGANLLATPLAPQAGFTAGLPRGGCSYDLRVVFADKTAKERKAYDLCKVRELPAP